MKDLKFFPHAFRDLALARAALDMTSESAEKQEFLGDRTLNLAVADLLRAHWPSRSVGEISRAHARLVSNRVLLEIAVAISLPGADKPEAGRRKLADTVEALIGAVLADAGYDAAKICVASLYGTRIAAPDDQLWVRDSKTALKEYCEGRAIEQPQYALEEKAGDQQFAASCAAAGLRGTGTGTSLGEAQDQAASQVLDQLAQNAQA